MKKGLLYLIVSLALSVLSFTVSAQSGSAFTFPTVTGDSLATGDSVYKKIPVTSGYNSVGFQTAIKKGTGTLDGKMYLYTSINGNNYKLTDSTTFTAVPSFGTQNANGGFTHTAIIEKAAPPGTSYMLVVTQTGSLTASPVKFSYTARRY